MSRPGMPRSRRSAGLPPSCPMLLPVSGAQHASTVQSRTLRTGTEVVQANTAETAKQPITAATGGPVVVGFDDGYARSRHRGEGRRFEVIAGKVITAGGVQHRFAFTRTGPAGTAEPLRQALAAAGVDMDTPATVLCAGDAGLWQLQREVLPNATPVLDWWHATVRFEHALQAARGFGRDTADACLSGTAVRGLERPKWRLWHGRWPRCRRRLAALCRWTQCTHRARGGRQRQTAPAHRRPGQLPRPQRGGAGPLRRPQTTR